MAHADIGLIGLGTMGGMLALNIADHGFTVAAVDASEGAADRLKASAGSLASSIRACASLADLVQSLTAPRSVLLLVPAGQAVDDLIGELIPLLDSGDTIIDAGNSNFRDTQRRCAAMRSDGVRFLGVGISGGAEGARFGPAMMAGGEADSWGRVAPIMTAISATYEGETCAAWLGPDGAGHFVKSVHNGIEYADMQMIAEVHAIMHDGLRIPRTQVSEIFHEWNQGPLASYLIEITAKISSTMDPETDRPILDVILDKAGQKGTGRWTLIEAQHLGANVSVIEAAVAARNMSAALPQRIRGAELFAGASGNWPEADLTSNDLEHALIAGKIICYAQGFDMLMKASEEFKWKLPLPGIAKLWRNGCIIRSGMLNDMANALESADQNNLCFAPSFANVLINSAPKLRQTVMAALQNGTPVPALSAALCYFDTLRSARTSANMIQAQRDFFGAHGFERTDRHGTFHGPWIPDDKAE